MDRRTGLLLRWDGKVYLHSNGSWTVFSASDIPSSHSASSQVYIFICRNTSSNSNLNSWLRHFAQMMLSGLIYILCQELLLFYMPPLPGLRCMDTFIYHHALRY